MTNINSSLTLCNYLIMSWMCFFNKKYYKSLLQFLVDMKKKHYFCSTICVNKYNEKVSYSNFIFVFFWA